MDKNKTTQPSPSHWQPSAPLWQRAPHKQANGAPLADLMMLVPRLKHYPEVPIIDIQNKLEEALKEFGEKIVFADINLKLKVIWVTVLPEAGLCREVALAIRARIPDAVMVGNQLKANPTDLQLSGWQSWAQRVKRALIKQDSKALPQQIYKSD
ncbi:MAG: hypothetical protein P8163_09920 [Candidatus Thiodiazotropha sp.]